mmetsp:Transcript_130410/g.260169  ORF Transcript_130410/g.260169 Transcript_130410/m.260169 type:complete len:386 (+) Transcript_130410:36-1193(+)
MSSAAAEHASGSQEAAAAVTAAFIPAAAGTVGSDNDGEGSVASSRSTSSKASSSDHCCRRSRQGTLQLCPLELRFSQKKMRNVFADGRLIEDAVELVKPVCRPPDEAEMYEAPWWLEAPFPPIEVLRWRCKLRDEQTGRPLLDKSGREIFEENESWFTLDNRRLYCLQKVAARLWPERCTVDVIAEIRKDRRMREIRKFRTLDSGESIMVGSRVDGVPFKRWAWRVHVASNNGRGRGGGGRGGRGRKGEGNIGKGGRAAAQHNAVHQASLNQAEDSLNGGVGGRGGGSHRGGKQGGRGGKGKKGGKGAADGGMATGWSKGHARKGKGCEDGSHGTAKGRGHNPGARGRGNNPGARGRGRGAGRDAATPEGASAPAQLAAAALHVV